MSPRSPITKAAISRASGGGISVGESGRSTADGAYKRKSVDVGERRAPGDSVDALL
jgi:hypothetical protein